MAASHPLASGRIRRRHPEKDKPQNDEDKIKHERGPSGRRGRDSFVARNRVNGRYAMLRADINKP